MNRKNKIIWDIGGTLFKPSLEELKPSELADFSLILYLWGGKKEPSSLDSQAIAVLQTLGAQSAPESQIIRLRTGEPLPAVICTFLAGKINSLQAKHLVIAALARWAEQHTEVTKDDLRQMQTMLELFFAPSSLVRFMKPLPEAIQLAQQCSYNKNNSLFILSNWDRESFEPFYLKYFSTIFSIFPRSSIVISGETGFVKPQTEIYDYFLKKFSVNPSDCFFIDDQEENIKSARTNGIDGYQFKSTDVRPLTEILNQLQIIKNNP